MNSSRLSPQNACSSMTKEESSLNKVRRAIRRGKRGVAKAKSKLLLAAQPVPIQVFPPEEKFVPQFSILARPGTYSETIFGWDLGHSHAVAVNIAPGHPIEFSTHGIESGLVGIHLSFGTHNKSNTCRVILQAFVHSGNESQLAATVEIRANELSDNCPFFFRFPEPILDPKDGISFRVSSPDSYFGNMVAIWGGVIGSSSLRKNFLGIPHCVNSSKNSAIVTPFSPVARDELFFPRYTASCFPEIHRESFVGWQGACLETRYIPIFGPIESKICFVCPDNNLSKIVFSTVNFERQNYGSVTLCLRRKTAGGWLQLHSTSIPTANFPNNAAFEFEFDTIKGSLGAPIELSISAPEATHNNCIAIVGTTVKAESELFQKLDREEGFISAVDTRQALGSPVLLYKKNLPLLKRLKQRPAGSAEFRAIVVQENLGTSNLWPTSCEVVELKEIGAVSARIEKYDLVIISGVSSPDSIGTLLELCRRLCVPAASFGYKKDHRMKLACDFDLLSFVTDPSDQREFKDASELYLAYEKIFTLYRRVKLPKISIVSVLYNKSAEIKAFLESLALQDYPGEIEILLVDDCSPDHSKELVEGVIADAPSTFGRAGRMPIKLLSNERNLGNCGSRNRALACASGDIALIVDADCPLNETCLSAHASAHGVGDIDVAIGTHNLETNHRDPFEVLRELEKDLLLAQSSAELQDPTVPQSFLNSITRNISIKRAFWGDGLFDESFGYSKDPQSGFGWEDVEMGYRLYKSGARFRYVKEAISVHISHQSSCDEGTKPSRSLKNFRRLIDKHPELKFVARRWVLETFEKIKSWIDSNSHSPSITDGVRDATRRDLECLERDFKPFDSVKYNFRARKALRVLSFRWHCPHQYELYKLPHHFSLIKFPEQTYTNSWEYDQRPLRSNVRFIRPSEVDPRDYDVAILHLDENSLFPENSNGVLGGGWGYAFRWLRENCPLPMVAVCHGTAQFRGQYDPKVRDAEGVKLLEYERQEMVKYLGDIAVVCNSHHAQAEWRFNNSRVIWHGFDPMEFGPASVGHGILTLGMAMKERPVYRGYGVYLDVIKNLPGDIKLNSLSVPRPSYDYQTSTNEYAYAKFRNYNKCIRDHSVYFNPTMRSPMPRSRGEAMMAGLVSVSAASHDVELFIKNGINGFYSNDPAELADYLTFLMRNEKACKAMGAKSRALASDIFNIDRYHRDWIQLLKDVVG